MRLEDYRFYSKLCGWFGILFLVIGIVLPLVTAYYQRYLWDIFPPELKVPYLIHGIILISVAVLLFLTSAILSREYKLRKGDIEK